MNDKEIKIKVTIDGKEGIAVLSSTNIEYEKLLKLSKQIPSSISNVGRSGSQSFTGMNQVIGQTGFLLSDMDMFFRSNDWVTNVRMGTMSVANNFSMVGQTIANVTVQAKSAGMSFGQAMAAAVTPMNMALLGMNALIFAVQLFTRFMSDGTKEAEKQADAIRKLDQAYSKYTSSFAQNQIDIKKLELAQLDKYPGQDSYTVLGKSYKYETEKKYNDPEKAKQLLTEIAALDRIVFLTNERADAEKNLEANQKKLKQINKENYEILVPMSTISKDIMEKWGNSELRFSDLRERNFRRAKEQLELWVKQDEEITKKQKEQKSIYDQLHITTKQELETELQKYQALLKNEKVEYNRLAIKEKILAIEEQLSKYNKKDDPVSRYLSSIDENNVTDKMAKYIDYSQEGIDNKKITDHVARSTGEKYDPNYDYLAHGSQVIDMEDKQTDNAKLLGETWRRTGSIMSNSLSHAIVQGKQFNTVLKEMGQLLLQVIIQEGIELGVKALFSVFEKGGIVPKAANGYIVPGNSYTGDRVPILANSGEMILNGQQQAGLFNFINQRIIPQPSSVSYNKPIRIEIAPIQIQGSATARGRDLDFNFERRQSIKTKYYGKGIKG